MDSKTELEERKRVLDKMGLLIPRIPEEALVFSQIKTETMFEKGKSGNPNGRPKGAKNRLTTELRGTLKSIVENELENLPESLAGLPANERLAFVLKLLPYVLPRVQAVDMGQGEEVADW